MNSDRSFWRNIGIIAHIDAGKTTTTERILYYTGKIHKLGEVDDGSATMDWMEQEQERGITITSAATSCEWRFDDKKYHFNIIDTPGHVDFTVEVERSLRVLDGAIALYCGVGGVQAQSETVWHQSEKYEVPKIIYVNKLDRTGADYFRVIKDVEEKLKAKVAITQIPIYENEEFKGIIDLLEEQAFTFEGEKHFECEIPENLQELLDNKRQELVEKIVETDEELLEKFLSEEKISTARLKGALRKATLERSLAPAFCGSSFKNKGVQFLLDGVVNYLPSPIDLPEYVGKHPEKNEKSEKRSIEDAVFSGLIFKIANDPFAGQLTFVRVYSGTMKQGDMVYNPRLKKAERVGTIVRLHSNRREEVKNAIAGDIVAVVGLKVGGTGDTICEKKAPIVYEETEFPKPVINVAVEPKTKGDQAKLELAINSIELEDPSFKKEINEDTGQILISGMGELHLEIVLDRLKREFKVECNSGKPRVAYKESVTQEATTEYEYDGIIGGKQSYAWIRIKTLPNTESAENKIIGIENLGLEEQYKSAIIEGFQQIFSSGPLGYPVSNVVVEVQAIETREDAKEEVGFKVAAISCLREALQSSTPILLEPKMYVEVTAPEEFLGDVIHSLNTKHAKIAGVEDSVEMKIVKSTVSLSNMFGYSTDLRSATQGRAVYTMRFSHYEETPATT
jgi:elongation factor G